MKSRISIDIDDNNKPFIKIEYGESNDVRDKMVQRFLQEFGGEVCFAKFQYMEQPIMLDGYNKTASVHPIPYHNLKEEISVMKTWIDFIEKDYTISNQPLPQTN